MSLDSVPKTLLKDLEGDSYDYLPNREKRPWLKDFEAEDFEFVPQRMHYYQLRKAEYLIYGDSRDGSPKRPYVAKCVLEIFGKDALIYNPEYQDGRGAVLAGETLVADCCGFEDEYSSALVIDVQLTELGYLSSLAWTAATSRA